MTMSQAIARIDHPGRLLGDFRSTAGGLFACGFQPDRVILMDFRGPPRDREAPITREEVEAVLRRVSGEDVRVEALEDASRWTDHSRLADTYRRGRGLLAGDAAHVHSPFGGQGMSLGLGDAANLGWKLAAVVRGEHSPRAYSTPTRPSGGRSPRPSWRTPAPRRPSGGPTRSPARCGTSSRGSCSSTT